MCYGQVIKANDDLTPEHHQFFLYQMLRGLKYIHTGVAGIRSPAGIAYRGSSCATAHWQSRTGHPAGVANSDG